eukprot:GILJ01010158.1.p1 GENE.GILJ01010158.1~~GILJ01010158.1.p1  ORF type:complete len:422 (+),score=23.67 GILJ01010158.1:90-1355(+)
MFMLHQTILSFFTYGELPMLSVCQTWTESIKRMFDQVSKLSSSDFNEEPLRLSCLSDILSRCHNLEVLDLQSKSVLVATDAEILHHVRLLKLHPRLRFLRLETDCPVLVAKLIKCAPNLQELHIPRISITLEVAASVAECCFLKTIDIGRAETISPEAFDVLTSSKALQMSLVSFRAEHVWQISSNIYYVHRLTNLQHLALDCSDMSFSHLQIITQNLSGLHSLSLSCLSIPENEFGTVVAWLAAMPSLEKFAWKDSSGAIDEVALAQSMPWPVLRKLSILDCEWFGDVFLHSLNLQASKWIPTCLSFANSRFPGNLSDRGLQSLIDLNFCVHLTTLKLDRNHLITEYGLMKALTHCSELRKLSIRGLDVTDNFLVFLAESTHVHKLGVLHLDGCEKLSDLAVSRIRQVVPLVTFCRGCFQ